MSQYVNSSLRELSQNITVAKFSCKNVKNFKILKTTQNFNSDNYILVRQLRDIVFAFSSLRVYFFNMVAEMPTTLEASI